MRIPQTQSLISLALIPLSLIGLALFAASTAAEAQLAQFPTQGRAGESIRLSGEFESPCFTGKMFFLIDQDDNEITLFFEEACDPGPPGPNTEYDFDRYLPPLPAGTYTLVLARQQVFPGEIVNMQVGPSRTLTVSQGRFRLSIAPPHPELGQEVFLDVASECIHDGFELAPGGGRVRRVLWSPIPILPPPCDTEPIHVTRFSLGELPLGEHLVLLGDGLPADGGMYESLSFEVVRPQSPALDLQGDRFRVTASWTTVAGASGEALAAPLTTDSGAFWFFRPDNLELLFKVLNGCAVNGHFWVLGAGLTDVGVEIEIEDTQTGATWTYENPLGEPFAPVQDTAAFDCP